jgi:hypothetical protein
MSWALSCFSQFHAQFIGNVARSFPDSRRHG